MGGCAVPFCNNSSTKGYIMKVFPRDPERRAKWLKNIGREHWTPTNNSLLCEVHFAPEMWEQRTDNKPKLKLCAVPTIFGFFLKEKIRNVEQSPVEEMQQIVSVNHDDRQVVNDVQNQQHQQQVIVNNNTLEPTFSSIVPIGCTRENKDRDQSQKLLRIIQRQQCDLIRSRRKLKALKYNIRMLQKKVGDNKYRKVMNEIFTEDQIRALFTKKRSVRNWSNETIKRALQLKFVCGVSGYEELKCQGIPLPSIRTLHRKLEDFKFEADNSQS